MENRVQIIEEYFQLRVLLNRANVKKNESTELDFEIMRKGNNLYLYATIQNIKFEHKIELCHRKSGIQWEPSYYTRFTSFETYCADFLNKNAQSSTLASSSDHLKESLRSLGISAK